MASADGQISGRILEAVRFYIEFLLETVDYRFPKPIVHRAAANAWCGTVTTVTLALPFPKTTSCSCARWHIERSPRSNIDIGMVDLCTCVSGDALATLKLNHALLIPILVKILPVTDKLVSLALVSLLFDRHMHAV